ncbi:MAG: alpha-amylase family glycosyl hydrolase [Bryobacteraceae bacterium]|jgi:glycosidase
MRTASWALVAALAFPAFAAPPAWLSSAVIYEVFPRDFSPAGDLNGVTAGLDRLHQLGVDVVWLMPIHPIGQVKRKGTLGSPYSVRDYYAVNPDYGTKDDLKRLVTEAHRRGMKVIIDIVANHTSWDSVMMRTPAFYKHNAAGQIIPPVPDWEDVAALDYSNPQLRAYMIDMLRYWIRDFDLDGFRCDAASMVPVSFWESARAELDKTKPGLLMLAEAHDPPLMKSAFDLDYAWPLHSALAEVFSHGRPARDLRAEWEAERAQFPKGALHLRISDDHDEERAIVRFGKGGALAASALMFTLDGVPLLYEGMEAGDTAESGAPALFEKLPVFWQIAERRPEFGRFYAGMIALRRAHPALLQGETEWLRNADEARIVTFERKGGGEEFLVAINFSNRPFLGLVDTAGTGFVDITPGVGQPGTMALPALALDAWGYRVFRRSR